MTPRSARIATGVPLRRDERQLLRAGPARAGASTRPDHGRATRRSRPLSQAPPATSPRHATAASKLLYTSTQRAVGHHRSLSTTRQPAGPALQLSPPRPPQLISCPHRLITRQPSRTPSPASDTCISSTTATGREAWTTCKRVGGTYRDMNLEDEIAMGSALRVSSPER